MTIWQKASWVVAICLALYVSISSLLVEGGQLPLSGWRGGSTRSNIVFIMSDDQDMHMDSLSYMPYLKQHITDQGTFFRRHYCTVALCCPSRASLLTGKAAHNTNVTDINPPYGRPHITNQLFFSLELTISQVDIPNLSARVSMKPTSPSGSNQQAIIPTTSANCSMPKQSPITTLPMPPAGPARISFSTRIHTGISTQHSSATMTSR